MTATVSSRTPEGFPNQCPVCCASICIEPSQPPGDAPCPACGTLLWFFHTSSGMRFHESKAITPLREKVVQVLCDNLGVSRDAIRPTASFTENIGADSLDIVELVMELEEEFDVTIPDEDAEKIKTVGDAIDYLARRGL